LKGKPHEFSLSQECAKLARKHFARRLSHTWHGFEQLEYDDERIRPKLITKTSLVADALPGIAMVEDLTLAGSRRTVGEDIVGTAFAADIRGYYLTAKHVINGVQAGALRLQTNFQAPPQKGYGMYPFSVQAVYPHPQLDVAVLAVPANAAKGRVSLPLQREDVSVGTDILLVGYPSGTDLIFCDEILGPKSSKSFSPVAFNGIICARVPDDIRPIELLVYDSTTFGGNSGAPVISVESGSIVGLHLRGLENHVGYAVPIQKCLAFVDAVAEAHEPRRQQYPSNSEHKARR